LGRHAPTTALAISALAISAVVGCDIYDTSLLGPQGGSSSTSTSSNNGGSDGGTGSVGGGGGGGGGVTACEAPSDCEGTDNECGTRTCENNLCGVDAAGVDTVVTVQVPDDCLRNICDGSGSITTEANDDDIEDDNQDCTVDTCESGAPSHTPKGLGVACTGTGPAKVCNAVGVCVECVDGSGCPSNLCTDTFTCAAATCTDTVESPGETDIDCGGLSCPGCENGEGCLVDGDCLSMDCGAALTCQESCVDGELNQDESAIDCGGVCPQCGVGIDCNEASDCVSGVCAGSGVCGEYQLLISEARSRGPGAGTDDFIEIYNPLSVDVVLPTDLEIATRSDSSATYSIKWSGNGETLPSHGHYLIAGGGFAGTADLKLPAGTGLVSDKVSIVLRRNALVLDALCYYCGATNPFTAGYNCEGTPVNLVGCTSNNADRSLERLPGGAAGNATDTGNNTSDFQLAIPAAPQNLGSPPAP